MAVGLAAVGAWVLWATAAYWLYHGVASCNNAPQLEIQLRALSAELREANISWMVDYGTMLGVARAQTLIPYEFDNDITIHRADLDRLLALKEVFLERHGFHLYGQQDYIFAKAFWRAYTLSWEPYLMSACARLYDADQWLYTDVFCDFSFPAAELPSQLELNEAKRPSTADSTYFCQGLNGPTSLIDPGRDMLPLGSIFLFFLLSPSLFM
eukprot:m.516488 g.516488  ORF g.516488 m.516488 type:complete len:211 (-) comp57475_c0_seq11:364-996(-)